MFAGGPGRPVSEESRVCGPGLQRVLGAAGVWAAFLGEVTGGVLSAGTGRV